jgi:hypothetical protein
MSDPSIWSTPDQIRQQVQRLWDDGSLLAARLDGTTLFPLALRLRQPSTADIGARFDAVRAWIGALEAGSAPAGKPHYEIVWRAINHRQTGRNQVPDHVTVHTAQDALRMIGRSADARRFDELAAATLARFPQLSHWLAKRSLQVLDHAALWSRILAVLAWFVAHPRPGVYLRQIDLAGIDSKFIESRKVLLSEMLDQVLPAEAVDTGFAGARQFEARYGLLAKPALVRLRILDPALMVAGLSDLSVPVAQFAALQIGAERVFITENEINALAFPPASDAIVVFGGGYGVDRLAQVPWLRSREVVYWGDIDTHGFGILDRLRASLPHVRSLLMDEPTLLAHRELWGSEEEGKRYLGALDRLTAEESTLFAALRMDRFGERVRMEQERIGFDWVCAAIANL